MYHIYSFDVVIVGTGIAGSALAWALRNTQQSVLLLDARKPGCDQQDFGETIPPECVATSKALGIDPFVANSGSRYFGTQSAWRDNHMRQRSFMRSVPQHGIYIDKRELLKNLISKLCVEIYWGAQIKKIEFGSLARGVEHSIFLRHDDRSCEIRARILIDASGRKRVLARKQGRALCFDRLVASIGYMDVADHEKLNSPPMPTLEAQPTGWWYCARRQAGGVIAIFFSDSAEKIAPRLCDPNRFASAINESPIIGKMFSRGITGNQVVTHTALASSSRALNIAGDGWVAIGDAARSVDPLSSQGIHNALRDAALVSRLISESPNSKAFSEYCRYSCLAYSAYLRKRDEVYSHVTRWPKARFWQLRQV